MAIDSNSPAGVYLLPYLAEHYLQLSSSLGLWSGMLMMIIVSVVLVLILMYDMDMNRSWCTWMVSWYNLYASARS
jgi:hypothetical protein